MINRGIHVRIKAILIRSNTLPGGFRLLADQTDAHNGLDALEAIFPGHHQTQRRAVLIRQLTPVHAYRKNRQRVHRFIQTQPFYIGPVDQGKTGALARHAFGILQGFEADESGFRGRLYFLEQRREGKADPGNDHRPGFHATQSVDSFLKLVRLHEVLQRIPPWLAHLPVHDHRPRLSLQRAGIGGRITLVGAELVEVVVVGRILERRDRLILDADRPPLGSRKFFAEPGRRLAGLDIRITHSIASAGPLRQAAQSEARNRGAEHFASRKIEGFRRDVRLVAVGRSGDFDQHGYSAALEDRCTHRLRSMREITRSCYGEDVTDIEPGRRLHRRETPAAGCAEGH
ncbi:hypothetical protein D3C80_669990 [compost metagenome]